MPKKKESKNTEEFSADTLEMLKLHAAGVGVKEIAEKYGLHHVTVSRRMGAMKKQLRAMLDVTNDASNDDSKSSVKKSKSIEPELSLQTSSNNNQPAKGGIDAIITNTTSAFSAMENLGQLAQISVASGAVPGTALSFIFSGMEDDNTRTKDERFNDFLKGVTSGSSFIFGLVEAMREFDKKKSKQRGR